MQPTHPTGMPSPGRLFRDRRALPRAEPGAAQPSEADLRLGETLRRHWPEYAVEALFLALFVLTAGVVSAWLEVGSGLGSAIAPDRVARRVLAGIVVGATVAALIYSPWGRRSGSHMNPAITLAYLRLGKIGRWDALFYLLAQLAGGAAAVLLLRTGMSSLLPPATSPSMLSGSIGPTNEWAAFLTEFVLAASAMLMILFTTNHASWFRGTGILYGLLIAAVVAGAAPLSDFGMNPARLLAVDLSAGLARANWLNLLPPFLGALAAVEIYRLLTGRQEVLCAKLVHNTHGRCIFRCQHPYQSRALAMAAIHRRAAGSVRP